MFKIYFITTQILPLCVWKCERSYKLASKGGGNNITTFIIIKIIVSENTH